jgi:uncharacterized protein (TIGR03437 family)
VPVADASGLSVWVAHSPEEPRVRPDRDCITGSSEWIVTQSGSLAVNPVCTIGGNTAVLAFARLSHSGLYQLNLIVLAGAANGDSLVRCTYAGSTTPMGDLITVE